MLNNNFLFLDETLNDRVPINITSVTGLLVPVAKFPKVRDAFTRIVADKDEKKDNRIDINPESLKYSNLLPSYDNKIKYSVVSNLVDLIVEERILIYRVGYYLKKDFLATFKLDTLAKQAAFCYSNLCFALQPLLKNSIVIPIFDAGFNESFQIAVDGVSAIQKSTSSIRVAGHEDMLSIKNSHNLTDVFFADDNHVGLVQLADIVSGLRKESEIKQETKKEPTSQYRKEMLSISEKLESAVAYEETIDMKIRAT